VAPTEALFEASARAVKLRDQLPPVLRDDPDIRAVLYCHAREADLLEAQVNVTRDLFFVSRANDQGLAWLERLLRITERPPETTLEERRALVSAGLQRLAAAPTGLDWVASVTKIVGPGWDYREHDPDSVAIDNPPEYTVRVILPFPPSGGAYARIERILREITPWHLDIQVTSSEGFFLDESQLDQELLS
jgi:hypothetical protein